MNAFTDRLLYGSNYNRTPEYRLICNFTMNGTVVKVTMEPKTVTNPGGAYESYTPIKDGTLLGYLNGLNHYFNSYIDTGITWNPKKKGDLVEILSIAKRSSAEKAGIVAGDMIAKVDGILVKDISMERFLIMMSGPEGKSTSLTLHRANGDTVITVTRSLIPAEYQP